MFNILAYMLFQASEAVSTLHRLKTYPCTIKLKLGL